MNKINLFVASLLLSTLITACDTANIEQTKITQPISTTPIVQMDPKDTEPPKEDAVNTIRVSVNEKEFTATLEKNEAVSMLVDLLESKPIVLQMHDYSGFEKIGDLGENLPENNRQITAKNGDIVLYNGNQICVFYGSNSWSYTKLATIDNLSGWSDALGSGDATITFSLN